MSKEKPVHKTSNERKEADVAFDVEYKVMEGKHDGRGWERTVQQFLQFAKPATVVSCAFTRVQQGVDPISCGDAQVSCCRPERRWRFAVEQDYVC